MNAEQFCYWLNGFFELSKNGPITADQAAVIKEHLNLVFNKVTEKKILQEQKPNDQKSFEKRDGKAFKRQRKKGNSRNVL